MQKKLTYQDAVAFFKNNEEAREALFALHGYEGELEEECSSNLKAAYENGDVHPTNKAGADALDLAITLNEDAERRREAINSRLLDCGFPESDLFPF